MSLNSLPIQSKQYTNLIGGNNNPITQDNINQQLSVLDNNKRKDKIKRNKQNHIYNNSEEQIINSNNQYFDDKLDYLNEHKKFYVDEVNKIDLYDPTIENERTKNLLKNKVIKFTDHYIEINSRDRNRIKKFNIEKEYHLSSNPLCLTASSNLVYINHPNHDFKKYDKIFIKGISAQTYYQPFIISADNENIVMSMLFVEGCNYALIKLNHSISNKSLNTYYCSISDLSNPPNNIYIGNIPITYLNNTHKIYLSVPIINNVPIIFTDPFNQYNSSEFNENIFYIKLPYNYKSSTPESGNDISTETRNYKINLYYYYGIPIYELNAGYPVTLYQQNEYYTIKNIDKNGYYIQIKNKPIWIDNIINSTDHMIAATNVKYIGGDNVIITKIKSIEHNYPNTNDYTINLHNAYKNVIRVEIVSSEFPNCENNIYKRMNEDYDKNDLNSLQYFQNNMFYWQNHEDGEYTYSIEVPPGRYTKDTLIEIMEKLIYDTPRIHYTKQRSDDQQYLNHNLIKINIDEQKNLSTFTSHTEYIFNRDLKGIFYYDKIENKFILIDETINNDINFTSKKDIRNPLFILIHCPDHLLNTNPYYINNEYIVGNNIEFIDIDNYKNIPGSILNTIYDTYTVPKIYKYVNNDYNELNDIDDITINANDFLLIKLPDKDIYDKYLKDTLIDDDNRGGVFKCHITNDFRILFNTPGTIGEILGFKNVGNANSITKFDSIITNQDDYISNIGANIIDNNESKQYIDFTGEKYILITCEELPVFENVSNINNIFAKILLNNDKKININTFASNIKYYLTPVNEINKLTFKFYNSYKLLCDFGYLNHSFTIKITTLDKSQLRTNISSYTETQI